jgi:hypothetical protein
MERRLCWGGGGIPVSGLILDFKTKQYMSYITTNRRSNTHLVLSFHIYTEYLALSLHIYIEYLALSWHTTESLECLINDCSPDSRSVSSLIENNDRSSLYSSVIDSSLCVDLGLGAKPWHRRIHQNKILNSSKFDSTNAMVKFCSDFYCELWVFVTRPKLEGDLMRVQYPYTISTAWPWPFYPKTRSSSSSCF